MEKRIDKDLEIIKKALSEADCVYEGETTLLDAVNAATRMSERIEELEKYNKELIDAFNEKNYKWLGEVTRCQKAEHEVDRLKEELAKLKEEKIQTDFDFIAFTAKQTGIEMFQREEIAKLKAELDAIRKEK